MKILHRFVLVLALILCGQVALDASSAELSVGVGRCVITPEQNMWLGGYSSRKAPSDGKIHDLYAKALAFEDEEGALAVIVTADLLTVTDELSREVAALAKERFGIPRDRLMLTVSHTHCSPVIWDNLADITYPLDEEQERRVTEYTEALPALFIRAIEGAVQDLEPAMLAWGIGRAGFAVNRREYTIEGVINRKNPIGPVDHDVPVLLVRRKDGTPKGILFGYACHNTTLDFQKICGDYAGFAQIHIESAVPGATALFVAGCGGDANPLPRRKLELAERYGEELGEAVLNVLSDELALVHGPIRVVYKEIPLELSEPPKRRQLKRQAKDDNVYIQRRAKKLLQTRKEKGALETTYPYPIQIWWFDDTLQMTALGGEVVVDYALLLKHEFGREKQFVIAYANDVCCYIPSLRVLREGGYEPDKSMIYYGFYGPWAPTVEQRVMNAIRELCAAR